MTFAIYYISKKADLCTVFGYMTCENDMYNRFDEIKKHPQFASWPSNNTLDMQQDNILYAFGKTF